MADMEKLIEEFIAAYGLDYVIELFGYDPTKEE